MRSRHLALILAATAAALALPGCAALHLGALSGEQVGATGPLRLDVQACSSVEEGLCGEINNPGSLQMLVGVLMPETAGAPDAFTVTLSSPEDADDVELRRNDSYGTALTGEVAPPAGLHWVGYAGMLPTVEEQIIAAALRPELKPGPGTGPLEVAVVAGYRVVDPAQGLEADRPFVCGVPIDFEAAEPEPSLDAACITSQSPETGTMPFLVNRLELTAPPATTITAGQSGDVAFSLTSTDERTPDAPLTWEASTDVPGASATAPAATQLGERGAQVVRVSVPAGTTPGDYTVGLVGRALGAQAGSQTAKLSVVAAAATPRQPSTPMATPSAAPTADERLASALRMATGRLADKDARNALRTRGLRFMFTAPAAGELRVVVRRRKLPVTIARGTRSFARSGTKTVVARLTPAGEELLATSRPRKVTVSLTFRSGGQTLTAERALTLR